MRKIILAILLICFVFGPIATNAAEKKKKTVRNIEIQTKDEMILSGTLSIPKSANINNKVPLVILLHSLGSNRFVYEPLANELKEKNIASIALDVRGHRQSTTKLSGKKSFWQNYRNKTYEKYPTDIQEIINFAKENYVAIDANRVSVVGADINANAASIAAGKNPKEIKSLVLITPILEFKGLKPAQSLMNYGKHPVTIIVCENDIKNYKDAIILEKYAAGTVNFIKTKTGGTGDNILKLNPELNKTISTWLQNNI